MEATATQDLVQAAEIWLRSGSPQEVVSQLDAEIERLRELRDRLAEKHGVPTGRRAGARRICRVESCEEPAMSRKHESESGYGHCRQHWEALPDKKKKHWRDEFGVRLARARAARGQGS